MTTNDIRAVRLEIKGLQDKCDAIYQAFINRHNINPLQEEWLFDHIFNGFGATEEILIKISQQPLP